ncbi:MAG TPA: ABC transporter substrate-binding protein [Methylomirabilota bacterium]|jgi:ABC-type nitrate/sulfonate/bicarbonate transport system substrate-binding protein|nr:ABC transporter substrate-binding protein [Methylomirabilota bacterium]HEV8675855.1 ABC transporter substrate-binding protein [Methylomirabilota bacterium]
MRTRWMATLAAGVLAAALVGGLAGAADPVLLRVRVFPGVHNLAIFAGQARGIFAKYGVQVELEFTPNSQALRDGLAAGAFEVAHAAVDNAVAMVETAGADVVVVVGGDSSMNQLFVQPEVRSIIDLMGKTVIVDAPNTAYALQLKKILLKHGLKAGQHYTVKPIGGTFQRAAAMREHKEYAATMLYPPYSIVAEREGLRSLGLAVKMLGPYQATAGFVRRSWAQANASTLERYLQGYVGALRWVLAPANRDETIALLAQRLKLDPDVAAATYAHAVDPAGGLTPDARLDLEGFRNVLALRAELEGQWGGQPPAPERYYDPQYYRRALAALGP